MIRRLIKFMVPECIKIKKLDQLFLLTADAFQRELPVVREKSFADRRMHYARYTCALAEGILKQEMSTEARSVAMEQVGERLYAGAREIGTNLRRSLLVRTGNQAAEVLELIYHVLGIRFRWDGKGEFVISSCTFSPYYTAEVCELISSLDKGLADGISDGWEYYFTERITEGCSQCKGRFQNQKRMGAER